MKKFLSLSLVVLLFASCDLLTGSGDSDTEPSVSLATKDSLLGTWKQEVTTETGTSITLYTFNADDTYIELRDDGVFSDPRFYAFKGTYSVDSEGNVTLVEDYWGDNLTSLSTEGVTWVPEENPSTMMFPFLIVGENQLYRDFLIANGPVSGIEGTWSLEYMETYWVYDAYLQSYMKGEYIFDQNGTLTFKMYVSPTGSFGSPFDTQTGTYTYSNGTLTITIEGEEPSAGKVAIYDNKYLIMGNETSATANAFLKQ